MFRSIEQIRFFRENITWLPRRVYCSDGRLNIDGYHIASALNIWSMFFAGYFFFTTEMPLWWIPIFWFIHGNIFSLFYHVIFMKPGHRDNFFLDWLNDLLGRPKGQHHLDENPVFRSRPPFQE
jgi:hypothetical protein